MNNARIPWGVTAAHGPEHRASTRWLKTARCSKAPTFLRRSACLAAARSLPATPVDHSCVAQPGPLAAWRNAIDLALRGRGYQTATFGKKHYFLPGNRPAFQVEAGLTTDEYVEPESYGPAFDPARFDVLQYRSRPEQKEQRRWILAGKFPVSQDLSAEARNVSQAIQWLEGRDRAKPFLLRVSFNAPHTPQLRPRMVPSLVTWVATAEISTASEPSIVPRLTTRALWQSSQWRARSSRSCRCGPR